MRSALVYAIMLTLSAAPAASQDMRNNVGRSLFADQKAARADSQGATSPVRGQP